MADLRDAKPDDVVAHRTGSVHVLKERKADESGWWLVDRGGLADYVTELDSGDWLLLTPDVVRRLWSVDTEPEGQR